MSFVLELFCLLVLLGLLAAFVIGAVYAIANKRPAMLACTAGGALIVLLLVGLGIIVSADPPIVENRSAVELDTSKANSRAPAHQFEALAEQLNQPRIELHLSESQAEAEHPRKSWPDVVDLARRYEELYDSYRLKETSDSAVETAHAAEQLARAAAQLGKLAVKLSDVAATVGEELVASPRGARKELTEVAALPAMNETSYPPVPRPDWVDQRPKRVGNNWREVIVAGDYATEDECVLATDVYLLLSTHERLQQIAGDARSVDRWRPSLTLLPDRVLADGNEIIFDGRPTDSRLQRLASAGIGLDFIRREVAKEEYLETVERSVGPMVKLYTLVEYTPTTDRELLDRWDAYRRQDRLAMVGVGAGSVLGLVGLLLGLLQVDTWTKGYYSKRLLLGVPAAIIGLASLLALVVI